MFEIKYSPQLATQDFTPEATQTFTAFKETLNDQRYGFFSFTQNLQWEQNLRECEQIFNSFQSKKSFVQVGMGGSILGAMMLIKALPPKNNRQFHFLDNIDPDLVAQILKNICLSETLFFIVSKSGNTVETLALFSILTEFLTQNGFDQTQWKNFFVFCSDNEQNELMSLGKKYAISRVSLPANIGGRFSILTSVGILPALFAGISVPALFEGCEKIKPLIFEENPKENSLNYLASTLFLLKKQENIQQTALVPYSSLLSSFGDWFVQLWAESLGKEKNKKGEIVFTGLTPLVSCGSGYQHSQLQLFLGGPKDKIPLFIEIQKRPDQFPMNMTLSTPRTDWLGQTSLHNLLNKELASTLHSFDVSQRPYIVISIPHLNECSLGGLILFFECLTVLMGHYLDIDPFDQPCVEIGKKYLFSC